MFGYFCMILYVFVFHYFVHCTVGFEIVENVNERQRFIAQTEVVNDGVIDVGGGAVIFRCRTVFWHCI